MLSEVAVKSNQLANLKRELVKCREIKLQKDQQVKQEIVLEKYCENTEMLERVRALEEGNERKRGKLKEQKILISELVSNLKYLRKNIEKVSKQNSWRK